MALQGSGAISFDNLRTEYGNGGSIALSEMYRGGSFVLDHSNNSSVPTSGTISMSQFYSQNNTAPYASWSTTQTTGSRTSGKTWAEVGFYKGIFGSIDDTTVDGQSGTEITRAYYRAVPGGTSYLQLSIASGSDNWANFVVNGTAFARGSASKSGVVWQWNSVSTPYPNGSADQRISIAINV
jgi:hypothetical protein